MKLQVRHELDVEPPLRLLANEKAGSGNVLLRRRATSGTYSCGMSQADRPRP